MAYYTRTGDKGKTKIIGGHIYDKFDQRVEAFGAIDEANSYLGYLISQIDENHSKDLVEVCTEIQQILFDCGSDLSSINNERPYKVMSESVTWLEQQIDSLAEELPPIEKFILPGGSGAASLAHICRTTIRRAERRVAQLFSESESSSENEVVFQFINRLSDYYFVLARALNYRQDIEDIEYRNSKPVFTDGIRKNKMKRLQDGEK
ncbi:cob(I)yrinic acid a,c-diamide adenosyltransferase [Aerococcaceae bacterium WGS1372]